MKMNKISRKLIKPHTPTSQNLKKYKLSFIDKELIAMNIAVVLFYESKPEEMRQLEESLAKTLVDFYPLAGRLIKNELVVDCNDEGTEFIEAEALDVELIDLVASSEIEQLNAFFPEQYFRLDETDADPLLSIQATRFRCGGVAIAVSVSHRVFDLSSLETFIAAWSSASNPDHDKMVGERRITPSFHLPSLFPCKDHGGSLNQYVTKGRKIVGKRLLFDKVDLAGLRSKIRPTDNGKTVSRVRVVCALIAKALIGVDRAKHGRSRDFVICQPVNMRERTVFLPQPKQSCGNFSILMISRRVAASEVELFGIQELVDLFGDAIRKTISDYAEILSPDRNGCDMYINNVEHLMKEISHPDTKFILFTDWSKFGFYQVDFGWGTPVWTSVGSQRENITVCMSNKEGDGIEAWVYLDQDDMPYFEQDEEYVITVMNQITLQPIVLKGEEMSPNEMFVVCVIPLSSDCYNHR